MTMSQDLADGIKYGQLASHIYHGPLNANLPTTKLPDGFIEAPSSRFNVSVAEQALHPIFDSTAWMTTAADPIQKGVLRGFYAKTYINDETKEAVIVFEGSIDPAYLNYEFGDPSVPNEKWDQAYQQWVKQDVATGSTGAPSEIVPAYHYSRFVKSQLDGYDIKFAGHSTGGGLASAMGVIFANKSYAFNSSPITNELVDSSNIYTLEDSFDVYADAWGAIFQSVSSIYRAFMDGWKPLSLPQFLNESDARNFWNNRADVHAKYYYQQGEFYRNLSDISDMLFGEYEDSSIYK